MSLNPVQKPSDDVQVAIFSYLNRAELARCSQICSKWNVLANNEKLWQKMVPDIFSTSASQAAGAKHLLRQLTFQNIRSNDHLVSRIQECLSKVEAGQKAKFTFFLGKGAGYQTITIEILPQQLTLYRRSLPSPSEWLPNHLGFDVNEHFFSLQPISGHGSLLTNTHSTYQVKNGSFISTTGSTSHLGEAVAISSMDSHEIRCRLPESLSTSPLKNRIHYLMSENLERLEYEQKRKRRCCLCNKIITLFKSTLHFINTIPKKPQDLLAR